MRDIWHAALVGAGAVVAMAWNPGAGLGIAFAGYFFYAQDEMAHLQRQIIDLRNKIKDLEGAA